MGERCVSCGEWVRVLDPHTNCTGPVWIIGHSIPGFDPGRVVLNGLKTEIDRVIAALAGPTPSVRVPLDTHDLDFNGRCTQCGCDGPDARLKACRPRPSEADPYVDAMARGYAACRELCLSALHAWPAIQAIVSSRLGTGGPRTNEARPDRVADLRWKLATARGQVLYLRNRVNDTDDEIGADRVLAQTADDGNEWPDDARCEELRRGPTRTGGAE